jgi:hypothetical protein
LKTQLVIYANVGVNYKNLKQTLLTLSILAAILTCCEKDNDGFKKSSFLIVGDSINCDYKKYNPDLVFSSLVDSLDIDFDFKRDVLFSRNSVYIDSCEEFLANCPPNVICDCFPTIYTNYNIELINDTEIAIDNDSTIHEFTIYDTISNKNKWSKIVKYPLYHRDINDPYWAGSKEYFIGFRSTQNLDTSYSWINIGINNSGFVIMELAIQK